MRKNSGLLSKIGGFLMGNPVSIDKKAMSVAISGVEAFGRG
jgi:hypothetical protein